MQHVVTSAAVYSQHSMHKSFELCSVFQDWLQFMIQSKAYAGGHSHYVHVGRWQHLGHATCVKNSCLILCHASKISCLMLCYASKISCLMLCHASKHTLPVHCRIPWILHIRCRAVCILKYKLLHVPQTFFARQYIDRSVRYVQYPRKCSAGIGSTLPGALACLLDITCEQDLSMYCRTLSWMLHIRCRAVCILKHKVLSAPQFLSCLSFSMQTAVYLMCSTQGSVWQAMIPHF